MIEIETLIIILVLSTAVGALVKIIKIPYTVALVLAGAVVTFTHVVPEAHLSKEMVFTIFLPPLLFKAAFEMPVKHFRDNAVPIIALAVVGVFISFVTIGLLTNYFLHIPLLTAFLFGSLIAATDPVSVLAIFKPMGVPGKLSSIIEGESLLNDGTAVVIFNIIFTALVAGTDISISEGILEFFIVAFGGLAIGTLTGYMMSHITKLFDDYLLEIMLSAILAYGAFLIGEHLHVSGVIATVAAGFIYGNYGRVIGMSPTTSNSLHTFWEFAEYLINSIVFILIGLEIESVHFTNKISAFLIAALIVITARIISVYPVMFFVNRWKKIIPGRWQHILVWGGLRGSLSLALVLGLPTDLPYRSELLTITFGVVLFSLLVQGLTMKPLIKLFKIAKQNPYLDELNFHHAYILMNRKALETLEKAFNGGKIDPVIYNQKLKVLNDEINKHQSKIDEMYIKDPELKDVIIKELDLKLLYSKAKIIEDMIKHEKIPHNEGKIILRDIDEEIKQALEHN